MKKTTLFKTMLLLCALIVGSGSVWAEVETIASFSAPTYHGGTTSNWTVTNAAYGTGGGGYYKLTYSNCSISTPSINWSNYSNIKIAITARTFGGPKSNEEVIYVKQGSTQLTTHTPSGSSLVESNALAITPSGTGSLTIVCSGAASDKGSGVSAITITGEAVGTSTVSAPSFSPVGGTFSAAQSVALSSSTEDASIYYTMTTDGSTPDDPTESSTLYSSAISVTVSGTIIKAKAFKSEMTASAVSTATYTITPTTPSFSASAGRIAEGTDVTITVDDGCVISYTTDGTDPASSGTATLTDGNSAIVNIDATKTIRAIAIDAYANESEETSAKYIAVDANEMEETKNSFTFDQAETVNGGALVSDITWTAYKGGASTAPGNYNKGIRLYQINSTNAYGGYVKLSAPTGFSITGFSITSTNTYATTVNYTEGSLYSTSFDGANYSLAKSSSYAISGLDCSDVYIYNVGTGSSGRLEIGSITVYYKGEGTVAINSACTDGEKYYGTYSNSHAFVVPSGLTVSEINVDGGKLAVSSYAEGAVVPKNTGVMVSSSTAGSKTITFTGRAGSALGTNLLKASGDEGISAANMTEADTKFYRLTMHNGTQIGFWWGAENGAAFDLAANKAYLAVPEDAMTARGLWFDEGETTSIKQVEALGLKVEGYYNLNGQRVAQPTKGLYIVNGKKVVIK